jgi:hypothetical protein
VQFLTIAVFTWGDETDFKFNAVRSAVGSTLDKLEVDLGCICAIAEDGLNLAANAHVGIN